MRSLSVTKKCLFFNLYCYISSISYLGSFEAWFGLLGRCRLAIHAVDEHTRTEQSTQAVLSLLLLLLLLLLLVVGVVAQQEQLFVRHVFGHHLGLVDTHRCAVAALLLLLLLLWCLFRFINHGRFDDQRVACRRVGRARLIICGRLRWRRRRGRWQLEAVLDEIEVDCLADGEEAHVLEARLFHRRRSNDFERLVELNVLFATATTGANRSVGSEVASRRHVASLVVVVVGEC